MRSRRIGARAAAILLGAGVALALLEIAVRLAGIAPPLPAQYGDHVPDGAIDFRRRPGSTQRGTAETGEFTFLHQHNSLGFRDSEHSLAKPAGALRIAAVGDSFTYGIGADFDDTYLAVLERLLNDRPGHHARVEIIKLGMARHFPRLELRTLETYGIAFAPDLVLVGILPNDIVDTHLDLAPVCVAAGYLVPCSASTWGEAGVWLYLRSALARVVLPAWSAQPQVEWTSLFVEDGPYAPAWRSMESDLERMQSVARAGGATLVVVALPQMSLQAEHSYYEGRLRRWTAAHGAVFVPTFAAMRAAASSAPLYWERDGHCTPAGYAVIARAIAAALVQQGLAP